MGHPYIKIKLLSLTSLNDSLLFDDKLMAKKSM